jgi:hypothetical protein
MFDAQIEKRKEKMFHIGGKIVTSDERATIYWSNQNF